MTQLIKRTYRITEAQDKKVKRLSTKDISESAVIRGAIDKLVLNKRIAK